MLPEHFTVTQLIKLCGGEPSWAKDPRLTSQLSIILVSAGFTQKIVKSSGSVERLWSKRWREGATNRDQPRGLSKEKLELLERIRRSVGM